MSARRYVVSALTLLLASGARAQTTTTIGFETDCAGAATPGMFAPEYKELAPELYAACGVASIRSGAADPDAGLAAAPQLVAPLTAVVGLTGSVALAGAPFREGSFEVGDLELVLSPAVNELSFDVLDLDNALGLMVELTSRDGEQIIDVVRVQPGAEQGRVHFTHTSQRPISQVVLRYAATGDTDGWFVDQLELNAWKCGDGEREAAAGESCDDGNAVQCDGCSNDCDVSVAGCLDGTDCLAPNASNPATFGCSFCDPARMPEASGEILATPRPASTPCNDDLFCTLPGSCDGAGVCAAPTNPCTDDAACTVDSCDEQADTCRHQLESDWCLIAGSCQPNGGANPQNACAFCDSRGSASEWSSRPVGTQCGDPSCVNGSETPAASCDAAGQCHEGAQRRCDAGTCADAQSCQGGCTGDVGCPQSAHCAAMQCVPDRPAGAACTRATECATNFCVDGVCCASACADSCESCNLPDTAGTCSALPAMTADPEQRCGASLCGAGGECLVRLELGAACDRSELCVAGRCIDGVCCDSPCDRACESCNAPGQAGVCTPYAADTDPARECTPDRTCSGASTCVTSEYELRGNGLCAAAPHPARSSAGSGPAALALFAAPALALALRRRTPRRRRNTRP